MSPRDALCWLAFTGALCALAYLGGLTVGYGRSAVMVERAIDTAVHYERLADSAWTTLKANRLGLASDDLRACVVSARAP